MLFSELWRIGEDDHNIWDGSYHDFLSFGVTFALYTFLYNMGSFKYYVILKYGGVGQAKYNNWIMVRRMGVMKR